MMARDHEAFGTVWAVQDALRAGGSDATSADDLPLSLLRLLPYVGHVALRQYLYLLRTDPQAISNAVVQMGIPKGGPVWLFTSYRPIKLGSGVNRLEACAVHRETMYRAEMTGDFDGRTFSYRKEISPQHMAFAVRASVVLSLGQYGEAHIVDADESGAFDTPIREDVLRLSQVWSTQCSFGRWAQGFYPRQQVHLLTTHGLAPPVSTREGFSQGCVFAATGYNLLGTRRTRASQGGGDEWVVQASGLRALPSESVFSDDRRYVERSAADISRKVTAAHHAAQHNCAVNNLAKQEYTVLRLRPDGEIKRVGGVLNVEGACTAASRAVPGVVGIPVQPGTYLPSLIPKILGRLRRWRTFARAHRPDFTLALRALYAYVLSSLDFVCRGSLLPHAALDLLQPPLRAAMRVLLSLPQCRSCNCPRRALGGGALTSLIVLRSCICTGTLRCSMAVTAKRAPCSKHNAPSPSPFRRMTRVLWTICSTCTALAQTAPQISRINPCLSYAPNCSRPAICF